MHTYRAINSNSSREGSVTMGQCYSKTLSRYGWGRRRRRQRHKAFEFAPKRSWKYKDATLLNQSAIEGNDSEDGLDDSPPLTSGRQPVTMVSQDSEEEIDTGGGEVRRSGLLAFSEDVSDNELEAEEEGFQTTPLHAPGHSSPQYRVLQEEDNRDRASSTSSQQIGRFEVMDIEEPATSANGAPHQPETAKLISLPQTNTQVQATA